MLSLYMGDDVNEVQAGIDEAGRGCFAGPVVAAAVVWDNQWLIDHKDVYKELSDIKDSKKLSEKKRKACFEFIQQHAHDWKVTFVDNQTIDKVNILNATYQAMHGALDGLEKACVDRILVDGSNFKTYISKKENQFSIPHQCVTGGDNKYLSIAAASILAKVSRDEYIKSVCVDEPSYQEKYDWINNKCYGTGNHIEGIRTYGLTSFHRKTFGMCKYM